MSTFKEAITAFNKGKGKGCHRKTTNEHLSFRKDYTLYYSMYSFIKGYSVPLKQEDREATDWVIENDRLK